MQFGNDNMKYSCCDFLTRGVTHALQKTIVGDSKGGVCDYHFSVSALSKCR